MYTLETRQGVRLTDSALMQPKATTLFHPRKASLMDVGAVFGYKMYWDHMDQRVR